MAWRESTGSLEDEEEATRDARAGACRIFFGGVVGSRSIITRAIVPSLPMSDGSNIFLKLSPIMNLIGRSFNPPLIYFRV